MPKTTEERPKRTSMFLSPDAIRNLRTTASRRRTERQAMEEALQLLAERDAQLDAMAEFVMWAYAEWGAPSAADRSKADQIWAEM